MSSDSQIPSFIPTAGTKPTSIKVEPWTDFPRQSYSIHGDDFCHEKPLTVKFTAKGTRSTLNIKETVSSKDGKFNVEDDVKLWFDLPNNHALYARVKSSNYVKLHYDHGLKEVNGRLWNFYSSFWTDKTLSKNSVRIGAAIINSKYQSDNRIRINTSLSGVHTLYWYNRTTTYWNQSKVGIVSVVDLTNKVVQKNNVLLSHVINSNNEAFLRFENEGFRSTNPNLSDVKTLWDKVTANYVSRLDSTTRLGLEVIIFVYFRHHLI